MKLKLRLNYIWFVKQVLLFKISYGSTWQTTCQPEESDMAVSQTKNII